MNNPPAISKDTRTRDVFHPLCLNSASHWRRLQRLHSGIDAGFMDRARAVSLVSPLTKPLSLIETLLYRRKMESTTIEKPPVFVVGHWRSGTTFLHNVLSKDPQFGYVTLFQTLMPGAFLFGRRFVQPLMSLRAPSTRPMDNVKIHMAYPSEEEFGLAHLCPQSSYNGWYFPLDWPDLFTKYALMQGVSPEDKAEWASAYRNLLVKATINFSGRRLVLKNPVNTARIDALLELFPDAKFIHIYRNPYDVFRSTLHLYREVLKVTTFQEISEDRLQEYVLDFYPRVMNAYWEQREHIPQGNHAEIRYEDFIESPLEETGRVYAELGLDGWDQARASMARFLSSRKTFKENLYDHRDSHRELVEEHWGFALDRLGYERMGRRTAAHTP